MMIEIKLEQRVTITAAFFKLMSSMFNSIDLSIKVGINVTQAGKILCCVFTS